MKTEHDFRTMSSPPRVACLYCNVERWKVEPEDECKMRMGYAISLREAYEAYDNAKTK